MRADEHAELEAALRRMGLLRAGESARFEPLTGGVSSAIYRASLPGRELCVKRALARLRVEADWQAPVERSRYEAAYLRFAGDVVPGAVPGLLGEDPDEPLFAMTYLEPASHPVWKTQLLRGEVDVDTASALGDTLGRLHAASAGDAELARRFATDALFDALRLEPYLRASARAHPDRADALHALERDLRAHRHALVHGDVSPKNVLVGPAGPVLLDAECAWYGDPSFDPAFCLNHLLLKGLNRPDARTECLRAFDAFAGAYLARVRWEDPDALAARIARLLPGLLLARVDGKSPVEYLDEPARAAARAFARARLERPDPDLDALRDAWRDVRA